LNQLTSNPASSIQTLESLLENSLGLPAGSNIITFDHNTKDGDALKFDFGLDTQFNTSLPFNFDLSSINGIPSFIKSLVGVSASGNLGVSLAASLDLVLGIGLTKDKNQGDVFLYTGGPGAASVSIQQAGDGSHNAVLVVGISATGGT